MSTEDMVRSLTQTVTQQGQIMMLHHQENQASIKNLERQIRQLAMAVSKLEPKDSGKLPSQTELNLRETVSYVSLRNGKKVRQKMVG